MQIFFKGTFLRSLREASTCSSSGIIWGKHVYICPSTNMWSTFIAINLRASPVQGSFVVMTVDNITNWYYILSRCISQHWHTISISSWLRYRRARALRKPAESYWWRNWTMYSKHLSVLSIFYYLLLGILIINKTTVAVFMK